MYNTAFSRLKPSCFLESFAVHTKFIFDFTFDPMWFHRLMLALYIDNIQIKLRWPKFIF